WKEALREAEGESHFMRSSGRYPLCGRGDINTYAIFAETNRSLMGSKSSVGCIVPGGLSTDDTTKAFFSSLVQTHELVSLYHFENEDDIFHGINNRVNLCLVTFARGLLGAADVDLVFCARQISHLADRDRHFSLTESEFELLNPNTRTCPT